MPLGSVHEERGRILHEGASLVLERDDGGRWRLDGHDELRLFAGRRVGVTGIRTGFDELLVTAVDGRSSRSSWRCRLRLMAAASACVLGIVGAVLNFGFV